MHAQLAVELKRKRRGNQRLVKFPDRDSKRKKLSLKRVERSRLPGEQKERNIRRVHENLERRSKRDKEPRFFPHFSMNLSIARSYSVPFSVAGTYAGIIDLHIQSCAMRLYCYAFVYIACDKNGTRIIHVIKRKGDEIINERLRFFLRIHFATKPLLNSHRNTSLNE